MAKQKLEEQVTNPVDEIFEEPQETEVQETQQVDDASGQTTLTGIEEAVDDSQPTLLDRIRGYGIDAEDEQTALQSLADRYERTYGYVDQVNQRMQAIEAQNRELVQYLTRTGQQGAVQQQEPSQPTATESPWRAVKPLAVSTKLIQSYQNADGSWRDNTPQEILLDVERYRNEAEEWLNQAMHNPQEFFKPGIEAIVRQMLSEGFQQHEKQVTTKTQYQRMVEEVRPYLYAQDPRTGQYNASMLSEFGASFSDAIQEAEDLIRNQGRQPTQEETFQLAYWRMQPVLRQITAPVQQGNGQPQPTTEEARAERQRQHMRQQRAAGVQQTAGSTAGGLGQVEKPVRKQNPMLSVGTEFAQSLYADGGI